MREVWSLNIVSDYELALLDLIGDAGIKFSGNPNELIASYAADGYGRLNGVGAWVDTYGPGELSAYCGHAGAYTEFVPVAHIVGYPGRKLKHHTCGFVTDRVHRRRYVCPHYHASHTGYRRIRVRRLTRVRRRQVLIVDSMFEKMAKFISVATAVLMDPNSAQTEIDRCLTAMLQESRPCYIGVPVDMSHLPCDASGLKTPLKRELPPNDKAQEQDLVNKLRSLLEKKVSPIFIVDGNAVRNNMTAECDRLSSITGFPTFTTSMGKGGTDETKSNFGGVYGGAGSVPDVKNAIESSDCVFWFGNFPVSGHSLFVWTDNEYRRVISIPANSRKT